ncbi:hypothetical protein CNBH3930 [Cryptococcus deneoformans B-3501A]|uniref:hypothetical protein n=1 Tax=Cryptococcus deneoformans (strain B-3501A) TaxID=283643 RepID=UPI000042FBE2|nr:hypothetical protein CNBH3930 [Cryptococcus neoformans var. neoformans B-3501A]EAL19294.1 hypothetical protein CNBH3930 [Cryptococcus neoformans var. neoformans B-3501A]
MMNEQIDPDAPISGTNVPKTIPQVTTAPAAPDTSLIDPPRTSDASASELPAAETNDILAPAPSTEPEVELTPDQKAMKARAERFGIPFNLPKPSATKPAKTEKAESKPAETREKAASINKDSLGLSDDILAKRAAKFGLPEKKEAGKPASKPEKKAEEVDPELAAKLAAEEEKKRKRAEKFGSNKPPVVEETEGQNAASEPDTKKVKV